MGQPQHRVSQLRNATSLRAARNFLRRTCYSPSASRHPRLGAAYWRRRAALHPLGLGPIKLLAWARRRDSPFPQEAPMIPDRFRLIDAQFAKIAAAPPH
jgi:hypothetical protein